MQPQDRRIVAIVILCIAFIQMAIVGVKLLQSDANLSNPLIPDTLINGIRNYSFAMMGCYFIAIILLVIYLKTQKFFWAIIIGSVIILAAVALLTPQIQHYFLNNIISQ